MDHLKDGRLHFDYNALGSHCRASASVELGPGRHELGATFQRVGKGGTLTLSVDGDEVTRVAIPRIIRMLGSTGLDLGRDGLSPVVDDYDPPFPFTGRIAEVRFHIGSRRDADDVTATARAELSKE